MTLVLDALRPHDLAYVLDSWLQSFADSKQARGMADYWTTQRAIAETLVSRGRTIVARPADSATEIAGWCCASGDTLHYALVRKQHARQGLCWALIEAHGGLRKYTHRRNPYTRFLDRAGFEWDQSFWR